MATREDDLTLTDAGRWVMDRHATARRMAQATGWPRDQILPFLDAFYSAAWTALVNGVDVGMGPLGRICVHELPERNMPHLDGGRHVVPPAPRMSFRATRILKDEWRALRGYA